MLTPYISKAVAQHYEARDQAIDKLVELYFEGISIDDREMFIEVLSNYGLIEDGFIPEEEYIIQEVGKKIKKKKGAYWF